MALSVMIEPALSVSFAAVHESRPGPERHSRLSALISEFGAEADALRRAPIGRS